MYKKQVIITNPSGLHARPGSDFVNLSKQFESTIKIHRIDKPEKVANAKSIVFVLSLGIKKNMTVEIEANGPDEEEAVNQLVAIIESGFGE
ncbi:MAG: HPr family phosphocarrier protein [Acholeplasmataceae bacterium]